VLPFDPDKARALLDEAGWVDTDGDGVREGFGPVTLAYGLEGNNDRSQALQSTWLEILGVDNQTAELRVFGGRNHIPRRSQRRTSLL
jgi:peptide/nickel transport system substrate-binding protein